MVKKRNHSIDILFVITLFLVFAMSVIMLTGAGAGVYEKIVGNMEKNYDSRTAGTYLFNRIHRADREGSIAVGTFSGTDALLMFEEIDNVTYCTYLYYYDGKLMELFTRYDQNIDPSFGNVIMELSDYKVSQIDDTLYCFDFTAGKGEKSVLYVHSNTSSGH